MATTRKKTPAPVATTNAAPADTAREDRIGLVQMGVASVVGFAYIPDDALTAQLIEENIIEVNRDENKDGMIAARFPLQQQSTTTDTMSDTTKPPASAAPSGYEIEDVPMPETVAKPRQRSEHYPFSALNVGQSFFVPATEKAPNPVKSLGSTIASAEERFSEADPAGATFVNRRGNTAPVMHKTREFKAVADTKDGVQGARVFRTK